MRYLIGFGLVILGGVLFAVTEFSPLIALIFIGVFLFASFPSQGILCDYIIANTNEALVKKRYYINFIPFTIISMLLTFNKALLVIPYKQEHFKVIINPDEQNNEFIKISRSEYVSIRNEQRAVYSTQVLSREFMEKSYTIEGIGFKRKKTRLIIVSVLAALMLTMITEPDGYFLTIIYEAVFLPMVILWIPEYKDAKILHNAYNKAVNTESYQLL